MKTRHALVASVLATGAFLAALPQALAHDVRPAVLALEEVSPGRFAVHWSPPSNGTRTLTEVRPRFPEHCRAEGETIVDCGQRGLTGAIRFDGGSAASGTSVAIAWLDGPQELRLVSGDPAMLYVAGTPKRATLGQHLQIAGSYAAMGVEHILTGVDHLMFVSGLLLFVRSWRRLLLTITSFTVAHSLTLAGSVLGVVHAPRGPVELCIALSILLLAVEATRRHPTWAHRAPWIIAFLFGLLHGFGFASALADVGLPPQHLPLALASFNLGVEGGQLLAVAVVAGAYRWLIQGRRVEAAANVAAAYALGIASVYWCMQRAVAMWQALQ